VREREGEKKRHRVNDENKRLSRAERHRVGALSTSRDEDTVLPLTTQTSSVSREMWLFGQANHKSGMSCDSPTRVKGAERAAQWTNGWLRTTNSLANGGGGTESSGSGASLGPHGCNIQMSPH
jgi:hypothetical protein